MPSGNNYLFFELDLDVSNLDLGLTIGNYVAYTDGDPVGVMIVPVSASP